MSQFAQFKNNIVLIGCGSIGQGLLPLLFKAFAINPTRITIITADDNGRQVADKFAVKYFIDPLTPETYQAILKRHLNTGDLLLNMSINVSSVALIAWCKAIDVLYLDTCVEPWAGGYLPKDGKLLETTNARLRDQALALYSPDAVTAVIAHGMNPGLISHFMREALVELAHRNDVSVVSNLKLSELARALDVKVVHIVERDTQDDNRPLRQGEFANTWSAEGLYSEAYLQRAEVCWGNHEQSYPNGNFVLMEDRVLCLKQHDAEIKIKSWLPTLGEHEGILVTHHEVISIANILSSDGYQPTVCYIYNPCPKAKESLANLRAGQPVSTFRVLNCEELSGFDEVGILLIHSRGALWHGSTLTSEQARFLVPHNSGTSLQVVAGIIGALAWMLSNPRAGVVEAESLDSAQVLAVARPYLGEISSVETNWHPGLNLTFDNFIHTNKT
ncbi:MAG: saccharopine dehydrogenase NADP-binding domain-containing protein [Betaproteobacteria bacterium]|nr:saccharopine dehydrogenase NADP-binding domain-containing protein [Betaproteobacteria bacterium]